MIKAIIFDNAGVIMSEAYWIWLEKNIPNLEEKREFFQDISHQVDRETITPTQFLEHLAKATNKTAAEVKEELFNTFILNEKVYELIKKLKTNYKIGLLSNFISEWLRFLFKKFNLEELFDAMVISTEHKLIKPDPQIYQLVLQLLNVKPEEAIFIDDRESNIKGAENVGIKGILFKNPQDLKKKLREFGIIPL